MAWMSWGFDSPRVHMRFSVIIPALNEEKNVGKAIAALKKQKVDGDFEIIVVDNNSDDNTGVVAKKAGADKVVVEKKIGTNLARQKGVEASKGEVLAFLDADSIPPEDWLFNIEKVLKRKNVVAVSGPYKSNKPLADFVTWRIYPLVPKLMRFFTTKKGGVILGGNFAAYRSAIEKIGGLPPIKFFGDDTAIAVLLARRVGKVVYTRKVWVESSPRRLEEMGIVKIGLVYFKHFFKIYFDKKYK
ncbi:MAG: family 2 glycosyl transferase [Candidatus Gottesmanbacteria bacterium GW2011_GWA2_47_9]|uniref:Family 2 glycosyl transferase n=1 Tax=Candidatus Gottesmanbacteria bacterium GW2011_GWA2_47_9 TaxID=1618445 RepID=A0A0G1WYF4_9BACT|nr:MAG: family 2 glycosyl transferase [Candidatus Gottesmanbacteria bacterium GW2011_GWA2_47_9]